MRIAVCAPQVPFERGALLDPLLHLGVEDGKRIPPHRLGVGVRAVRGAEEELAGLGIDRVERRTNSGLAGPGWGGHWPDWPGYGA